MSRDTHAFRAVQVANEHEKLDKQRFDPLVCQCCEYRKPTPDDPECVCDGLTWYLDKDGRIECQAHRFARAVGGSKKSFFGWRKK